MIINRYFIKFSLFILLISGFSMSQANQNPVTTLSLIQEESSVGCYVASKQETRICFLPYSHDVAIVISEYAGSSIRYIYTTALGTWGEDYQFLSIITDDNELDQLLQVKVRGDGGAGTGQDIRIVFSKKQGWYPVLIESDSYYHQEGYSQYSLDTQWSWGCGKESLSLAAHYTYQVFDIRTEKIIDQSTWTDCFDYDKSKGKFIMPLSQAHNKKIRDAINNIRKEIDTFADGQINRERLVNNGYFFLN